MSVRIVAGKHKGRNLLAAEGKNIRPTSSRTRESVFNILAHHHLVDLIGADVADLCCGTGAFAIEALSRGASRAILVDHATLALQLAQKNILHVGEMAQCKLLQADVGLLPLAYFPCDIIYLDPPYGLGLVAPALQSLLTRKWLKPEALILVEQQERELLQVPEGLRLLDTRIYGNAKVSILTNIPA